jgi:GntR family transcriptional repressor for pyruvate dehydrogenase complex
MRNMKIKREQSLYLQIADQLEMRILKQELKPGDKLPSEQELLGMLEVSRPTIREAVKVLRDRNLVEVRPGDGTYVKQIDADGIHKPLKRYFESKDTPFHELMEIRQIVEPFAARQAAHNINADQIEAMEEAAKTMAETVPNPMVHWEADRIFHTELIQAAGNDMLLAIMLPVYELMKRLVIEVSTYTFTVEDNLPDREYYHKKIIDAIKSKNADEAERLMRRHVNRAAKDVDEYMEIRRKKDMP